jgi:aryl-alcohol dehydrogenase-like predicted oxidoreductase
MVRAATEFLVRVLSPTPLSESHRENDMKYRLLGRTGLYVSQVSLGTMTFGGGSDFWNNIGGTNTDDPDSIVGRAVDAGVNLIDTADYYSAGLSEEIVGASLRRLARARDTILIATKARLRMGGGVNQVGLSRVHLMNAVEGSLRRLKIDHIDLYQLHGPDPLTPLDETLRALDDMVRQGKVRHVGVCNFPAWKLARALSVSERLRLERLESAQMYYSLAGRDIEREVVPLLVEEQQGLLVWSPLAGGFLSGKYAAGEEGGRRRSFDFPPVSAERGERVLSALSRVADRRESSMARVALAWLLAKPFVTSVIMGARTNGQLADNLGAVDLVLTGEDIGELDQASALPAEYPGWMVERQAGDRSAGSQSIAALPVR